MISFIMPAKDEEKYIHQAMQTLIAEKNVAWELIIIDDNSSDQTCKIVTKHTQLDKRIKLLRNNKAGKVHALNLGYAHSSGNIIKCIDADDILHSNFFIHLKDMTHYDAVCHDAAVVDQNLEQISNYRVNKKSIDGDFSLVSSQLISPPKYVWSFTRAVGDKIFPMPEDLPFEDVWMALSIKRFAKSIHHIPESLYLYRQHSNQTFGGILKFDKNIAKFRANRILKLLKVIENNWDRFEDKDTDPQTHFSQIETYYKALSIMPKFMYILKLKIPITLKIRLLIHCKAPFLLAPLARLKWAFT